MSINFPHEISCRRRVGRGKKEEVMGTEKESPKPDLKREGCDLDTRKLFEKPH
jgi:hypothetical protein